MAVLATRLLKNGSNESLQVDLEGTDPPNFPPFCPCCHEKPEPGAAIEVKLGHADFKEITPLFLQFPACKVCARHVPLCARIYPVIGILAAVLALLTMAAGLIYYVGHFVLHDVYEPTIYYVALTLPFRGPLMGMINFTIAIIVWGIWGFTLSALWLIPYRLLLAKSKCAITPVTAMVVVTAEPHYSRYVFENVSYGQKFAKANSAPAPAPVSPPPQG